MRLGGALSIPRGRRLTLVAGGGVTYSRYEQKGQAAGLTTTGRSLGPLAQAGVQYLPGDRYLLVGRIELSSVPTASDGGGNDSPNLGGVDLGAGFGIRF